MAYINVTRQVISQVLEVIIFKETLLIQNNHLILPYYQVLTKEGRLFLLF